MLFGLLAWGLAGLRFEVPLTRVLLLVGTALATQAVCTRLVRLPRFDPWSALISSFSLCLLLRTNEWWWAALAAVLTIASKFTLRWNGRHVFNPTNFALAVLMMTTCTVAVSIPLAMACVTLT